MNSYHMRRKDRQITDPEMIGGVLRSGKYAVIALCRENEPYVVTLSYGYDEAGKALYFHCAPSGLKLEFIQANPCVCATVIQDQGYVPGQCEHRYISLVLRGRMTIINDLPGKKHGLDILLAHLEDDPAPILARNIKDQASYDRFVMLRMDITECSAKQGS
ncbi:MAG TPA: pyridoxamine 5'-phosphate oxidase family protein [Bacillota bacterium]